MTSDKLTDNFAGTGEELLTTGEMYAADAAAIVQGVQGAVLIENAGQGIVKAILDRWSARQFKFCADREITAGTASLLHACSLVLVGRLGWAC